MLLRWIKCAVMLYVYVKQCTVSHFDMAKRSRCDRPSNGIVKVPLLKARSPSFRTSWAGLGISRTGGQHRYNLNAIMLDPRLLFVML